MTIQVANPEPTQKTDEDRAREEIERARRVQEQAVRAEYDNLMEIAWRYQHAASAAILAAQHTKAITDDTRRDLIDNAVKAVDAARRYLYSASDSLAPDVTDSPF
jgi:hypothetical protein